MTCLQAGRGEASSRFEQSVAVVGVSEFIRIVRSSSSFVLRVRDGCEETGSEPTRRWRRCVSSLRNRLLLLCIRCIKSWNLEGCRRPRNRFRFELYTRELVC